MEWALFGSTFVISFVLIVILAEHLRQKRKIALREIIQKERLTALEKGIQMPEHNDLVLDEEHAHISGPELYRRKVQWFRFTTLSVSLFLIFGGIGFMLAFHFTQDAGLNQLANLGMLPFMAGIGLLLFYFLTGKENA